MITCPSCLLSFEKLPEILNINGVAGVEHLTYYFCHHCELIFHTRPFPDDYYRSTYRKDYNGEERVTPELAVFAGAGDGWAA